MRKRLWAALLAGLLTLTGLVAVTAIPAQADPPPSNCYPVLTTCGYPTSATTGPRSGHTLTLCTTLTTPACDSSGNLTISTNNATVSDMEIHGCINVQASGVTLSDILITDADCYYYIQDTDNSSYGFSASYVRIDCSGLGVGLSGWNFTFDHGWIGRCADGASIVNDVTISNSVIAAWESSEEAHGDLIQGWAYEDANVTIDHNLLAAYNPMTSALSAANGATGYTVTDNFFGGGAYSLYCAHNDWVVTGNRFYEKGEDAATRDTDHRSPAYGYTTDCEDTVTWSGNFTDRTGSTLNDDGTTS